ncbi:MAG: transporter substrate-binding domain-containing protein [Actinobacteria bacterium]|nr:transporter substrate-binding domain-containing protein [Actinomycetota bacterium]
MKRLGLITVLGVLGAAVLATWGIAATVGGSGTAGPAATPKPVKFPALPADVKSRNRWVIGVKCDFPPFGFIDVQGRNAGYDVEVARQFTQFAFGKANRLTLVCVTTPSRIPTLQSKRVDMIISTLTWTKARTEVIDFSVPYYSATGRLLVKKDSSVASTRDLKDKTVISTRGALYGPWTKLCLPGSKLLEVDTPSSALLAVKDGRADTFMFDDAFLLGAVTTDRDLKILKDKFLAIPWGIGIRKGDTVTKKWVDFALRRMQARDLFLPILRKNAPKSLVDDFAGNVPRPGKAFRYPEDRDAATDCTVS